jgi:uncharacterized damage-inducible protein DinB
MSSIEKYRHWYEHEKASNAKMLEMIASVPEEARSDPRFNRALVLAAHLAACREIWLDYMAGGGSHEEEWWPENATIEELPGRFAAVEQRWTDYLAGLQNGNLDVDFDFPISEDSKYRWNIEGQIVQLMGHAPYHRGQIALLVEQLGGETVDTDYADWASPLQPERWKVIPGA